MLNDNKMSRTAKHKVKNGKEHFNMNNEIISIIETVAKEYNLTKEPEMGKPPYGVSGMF